MSETKLILGDCLEKLKEIPDNSVDCVITDPPYYKIMRTDYKGGKHEWDNQWENFDHYKSWLYSIMNECKRVLKENGSLFVFMDDKRSAYVRLEIEKLGLSLINEIIWVKKNNMTMKGWSNYRCFAPITERILFFGQAESEYELSCDGLVSNVFSNLRQYLIEEKDKVGITLDEVNILVGTASMAGSHYFANSQWCFPTKEHYERMQLTFNAVYWKILTIEQAGKLNNEEIFKAIKKETGADYEVLRKDYEVLRKDYDDLRKDYDDLRKDYDDLRRYFKPQRNYTDVWTTNITCSQEGEGQHPTQKPVSLIRRILETCSKEGHTILDPFMGSGTTGVACAQLNRNFIGIELNEEYFNIAKARIESELKQGRL